MTFTITQSIHLHVIGRNFSENLAISNVRSAGEGGGVRVTLSVACGNPCSARTSFPQGAVLGSLKGTIAYHDATTAVHSTASRYSFGFTKPGFTPGAFSYSSLSYRCDDAFSVSAKVSVQRAPGLASDALTAPSLAASPVSEASCGRASRSRIACPFGNASMPTSLNSAAALRRIGSRSIGCAESATSHTASARRNIATGVGVAKENVMRKPSLLRSTLTDAA